MRHLTRLNKVQYCKKGYWSTFCRYLLVSLLIACVYSQAGAAHSKKAHAPTTPPKIVTLVEYLAQENTHLSADINTTKHFILPKDQHQFEEKVKLTNSLITITKAKIDSLEGFLTNQNNQKIKLLQRLKHLQQMPLANAETSIQTRVARVEELLTENDKNSELIYENLVLARDFLAALRQQSKDLDEWNVNFQLQQQLLSIREQKKDLIHKLNSLYTLNVTTKDKKHTDANTSNVIGYETKVLVNNQFIGLIHLQLDAFDIQKNVIKAKIILLKSYDTKTLQGVTDIYGESIAQYSKIEKAYQQMDAFIKNEAGLIIDKSLKKSVAELQSSIASQLQQVQLQKQVFRKDLDDYQVQLRKLISGRQTLAEYNINSWPLIIHKLANMPNLLFKYTKTLSLKVYDSFLWLDPLPMAVLFGILSVLLVSAFFLRRFLRGLSNDKERSSLSGYLYDGALTILQRNIPYLCVIAMLCAVFYFTNISYTNYQLLMNLVAVWFTFRLLIMVIRLVLLERISDSSGKDVKLYYRLKWLLLFGGWTTALMTFSHLLPLSLILQDIFNRLFMLFILSVSLVAWKSRDVIPYLMRPVLLGKKRYFRNAVSVVALLIPITLFTTGMIGLLGFVNLAWTLSSYQGYILIVLVSYILARGLVFDALELFSEWMISSLQNGWLWIEVFLKPLDKIVRVALLLSSIGLLFFLFGWRSDSYVITGLEQLSRYTIVNLTGIHITVASTIEFVFLVAIFVWAAKWTREFCFRWLYIKAKDAGVRNSLSVFTQYTVILLGGFITLRVLGLDLSGMSIILGGLAVGMGFGLRDFASNIIGGIMLLIERPVREGDLITIGEYEGQVSHIGIRSMRVSSWDNTEVLIPNAETFNKPFTNWTHQDGIVRTVIPIKVSRSDDPVMIQQLILDVLAIIPEIVSEPPVQVFLKKIDDVLIEFEARYFTNVQIHNRVEVRSKVLFAITAQFKAAGVRPPVEPITVEIKDGHGDYFIKKHSTTD